MVAGKKDQIVVKTSSENLRRELVTAPLTRKNLVKKYNKEEVNLVRDTEIVKEKKERRSG